MRYSAFLICPLLVLWGVFASAQQERKREGIEAKRGPDEQKAVEETVCVSRSGVEGLSFRLAEYTFEADFLRQGLLKAANPGGETLLILTSDEPGSFSAPEVRTGIFIEWFRILPRRPLKDEKLPEDIPVQVSYPGTVVVQVFWRGLNAEPTIEGSVVEQAERKAVNQTPREFREQFDAKEDLQTRLKRVEDLAAELSNLHFSVKDYDARLKDIKALPKSKDIQRDLAANRPKDPRAYVRDLQVKSLNDLWGEMRAVYTEHVRKQGLLKGMGLDYSVDPRKASPDKLEKLAWFVLQFRRLKENLKAPGPGADDHGDRALGWLISQAYLYYDYALGKAGAAERLSAAERLAADKILAFSIAARFTPDESQEKERLSSPARPFRAGLLGDALRQIEMRGRTDPAKGSVVHWWVVDALHPAELAFSVGEQAPKTHVICWFPRSAGSRDVLVRVRAIGKSPANYTVKCADSIVRQGDAACVFANQQPLSCGFPY